MKKVTLLIAGFLLPFCCLSQRSDTHLIEQQSKEAGALLPEQKKEAEKALRLEILLEKAYTGDAISLHKLGRAYKKGTLTEPDYEKAFDCFTKSAAKNYAPAWFDLGDMYKQGMHVPLDYEKAYSCFVKCADLGFDEGFYGKGYMEHKGLGCPQSYATALVSLRKGASYGSPGCMYLLGLFYRNGFGIPVQTDSAFYWLKLSAGLGYRPSEIELHSPTPYYNPTAPELVQRVEAAKAIAEKANQTVGQFTRIEHKTTPEQLEGTFEGFLLMYDWAGSRITTVTPVTMEMHWKNNTVSGIWAEAGRSDKLPVKGFWQDKKLVFQDMDYVRPDYYRQEIPQVYRFQNATLRTLRQPDGLFVTGNLSLYLPDDKEPQQPMTLVLEKKMSGTVPAVTSKIATVSAYPNPFQDQINVEFSLNAPSRVLVKVTSIDGRLQYTSSLTPLEMGDYRIPISLDVPSGTYFVTIEAAEDHQSIKLIKP